MTSFLWNGYKTELQKEDLYEVLSEDDSKVLGDQLERYDSAYFTRTVGQKIKKKIRPKNLSNTLILFYKHRMKLATPLRAQSMLVMVALLPKN